MIDRQIHVALPSYRRAGQVRAFEVVPYAYVWVPESQGQAYEEHYPGRVITIPDNLDGNIARKRNAILDRSPCPWTLILDDDITRIGMFEAGGRYALKPEQLRQMICHYFVLADNMGVRLWGINQNRDEKNYRTQCPLNLMGAIFGPFGGHLSPTLRYDERIPLKEDYDFWLQNIAVHRFTLRVNKYHYEHNPGKQVGGVVSYRTMAEEEENVRRMLRKWGPQVYKMGGSAGGKSAKGNNILNGIVRPPINGC